MTLANIVHPVPIPLLAISLAFSCVTSLAQDSADAKAVNLAVGTDGENVGPVVAIDVGGHGCAEE